MIDIATNERLIVEVEEDAGPYMMVAVDQLDAICQLLEANQISFWVARSAISIDGGPETTVINFRRNTNAPAVQALLDQVS